MSVAGDAGAPKPLDPHVGRLLDTLALGRPRDGVPEVAARRAAFARLMGLSQVGARVAATADRAVAGPAGAVAVRIYTPRDVTDGLLPGLVYLHGGGLVCGDLETHDAFSRTLCEATGCRLIAVDYRRAPEHPFPAAVQDAHAATMWAIAHAAELGLDPRRIGIAGDSAGATLAAAVCQLIAPAHPGALAVQLLLCPILDWTTETPSRRSFAQGYLLDRAMMARELQEYVGGGDVAHPHVSPLRAVGLSGQPPAHIHTAQYDPLRDEGHAYAARLRQAGVAVQATCHDGMVHMFYALGRAVPYARAAHRQIGAGIREAFAGAA